MTTEREKSKGKGLRIAVMHSGAPSPGMNPAVRAFIRLGLHKGHTMLGICIFLIFFNFYFYIYCNCF